MDWFSGFISALNTASSGGRQWARGMLRSPTTVIHYKCIHMVVIDILILDHFAVHTDVIILHLSTHGNMAWWVNVGSDDIMRLFHGNSW